MVTIVVLYVQSPIFKWNEHYKATCQIKNQSFKAAPWDKIFNFVNFENLFYMKLYIWHR